MLSRASVISSGTSPQQSQGWHRDPGDKKICKIFLYVNDVDETAGPFMYVRGSQYGGVYRRFFPQRLPRGYYPPEGAVEKIIPSTEIQTLTGKAGTIIFADTTGIHRGGYATKKERIMFTAAYSSGAVKREHSTSWRPSPLLQRQYKTLHPLAQFAVAEARMSTELR